MIIIPKREIWTRQPQNPVAIDGSHPLGRQRWAMVHVPGISLFGTANPIVTAQNNAVTRYGLGGNSLVYTSAVANGGFTYGQNAGLQLNVLSGVCVFTKLSGSGPLCSIFGTSWSGATGGGIIIGTNGSAYVEMAKHEIASIAQTSNSIIYDRPNVVAWSYNSSTGRARIALNGALSSATNSQSLTHNTVATLGYYSFSGGGAGPGEVALLAISPDECLDDRALIGASLNPWAIFQPYSRRAFAGASGGGGTDLYGAASGTSHASGTATLSAQVALAGVGVALAGGTANASVAVPISATGISVSSGDANLTATIAIAAAGLAQAAGAAGLSASVLLAGSGAALAAGNATLAAQLAAMASGSAQAGGSATLSGGAPGAISAIGSAVAGGSGTLNVTVQIAATGSAQAGGTAVLSGGAPGAITASGGAIAGGSGTLAVTVALTAAGFVQAMGAGAMLVSVQLAASGLATAGGSAVLRLLGAAVPVIDSRYIARAIRRDYTARYGLASR